MTDILLPTAIEIDHLLVGCPDLVAGCDYMEALFGSRPQRGGSHRGIGTRNALLGLEAGIYVEVIAPDREQAPTLPLSNYLSQLPEASILWWAARCTDILKISSRLATAQIRSGEVESWSRRKPDGETLSWKLLMPSDASLGPAMPFFIQWDDIRLHPSRSLQVAGKLDFLHVTHPDGSSISPFTADCLSAEVGCTSAILASVSTPGGIVELQSPATDIPTIGSIR